MVTPQMIGGPRSFLVVSGETPEAFKSVASLAELLGRPDYLGIAIDTAARYDLAALSSMYGMFSGIFNGMALLNSGHTTADEQLRAGIPYASMIGVVLLGMGLMAYMNGWQSYLPQAVERYMSSVFRRFVQCIYTIYDASFLTVFHDACR
ncbi:hypothetical protein V8C42DRAFT_181194 [Trichoderma barbatum]